MTIVFYLSSIIAVVATLMAITRRHPVHALLHLIVSLLAVATVFYVLGAPFMAALEVIVYAGAIMVLFVFVVMMMNLGEAPRQMEREWLRPGAFAWPSALGWILFGEAAYLVGANIHAVPAGAVSAKQVAIALYGPYVIGVELASLLLMGGLIAAFHLGRRTLTQEEEIHEFRTARTRAAVGGDVVRSGSDRTSHAA